MSEMSPNRSWDRGFCFGFFTGLFCVIVWITFLVFTSGCTVRVEGFQRPEPELQTIIREECIQGVHQYRMYLRELQKADGARPMRPVY